MILNTPGRDSTGRERRAGTWQQLVVVSAIALIGVVPLVGFAMYAHETISAEVVADGERDRLAAARVTAGLLSDEFARVATELEDEASDEDNFAIFDPPDEAELGRELKNLLIHFPLAVAAGAFDARGEMVASRGDPRFVEGFPRAFRSAPTTASALQVAHRPNGAASDSIVLAMAVSDAGEVKGTFAIALDPTRLLLEVASWLSAPERSLVILDESGQLVTATPPFASSIDAAGEGSFAASAPLDRPAWTVRAVESRATALAYRDELLLRLDLASGAATLSVFVLGWLRTRAYLRARRQERVLQRRESRQRALLLAQSELGEMLLVQEDGRLTDWNQAALDMTGRTSEELAALRSLDDLFSVDGRDLRRLPSGARIELQLKCPSGPGPWLELTGQPLPDAAGMLIIARDVTQRRALQRELEERATHDRLTGLPNRTLLQDRIAHAFAAMKRRGGAFSVLVLDLDLFKRVNDTLGHHAGDQLLVEVGQRLKATLREQDTVARLGGDEIAVLVEETDAVGADAVARRITEAMQPGFVIGGRVVRMSASIGIAVAPADGEDGDTILRRADLAMYEAKQQRGSHRFFDRELEERMFAEVHVASELRRALDEDQFELYYQPKVSARTHKVAGIEALVRWVHPTRGLIGPDQFVPHAARARLGVELDAWVLRNALVAARTWQRMGLDVPISVNVSAQTVNDPGFVDMVRGSLRSAEIGAHRLVLELTEDATLTDPRRVGEVLRTLTADGVRASIDDFGTGYSSLLTVQHVPASELKIDRAFVRDLLSTAADQKIVRAAIALAHSLGMTATAEGVEDAETWELLQQLGCEEGQGFLFSRPLPMADLVTWLLERSGELDEAAIHRYADRLLQLADRDEAPDSNESIARLRDERQGIRAVLGWALRAQEVDLALALAAGTRRHWCDAGRLEEASHWLGAALAAARETGTASTEAIIDALNGLGVVTGQQGDLDRAAAALAELDDQRSLADVLDTLGAVALAQRDTTSAWRAYARSLSVYRDHVVAGDVAQPLLGIAVLVHETRADLALQLIGAARGIAERFGSKPSLIDDRVIELVDDASVKIGEAAAADEILRGSGLELEAAVHLALSCVPDATATRSDDSTVAFAVFATPPDQGMREAMA